MIKYSGDEQAWHLDKKVPLGLILALVLQTIVITAIGTSKFENIDNRVANLEKSDSTQTSHESRIVILEQQFGYIRSDLAEIKSLLRRKVPDDPPPQ